MFTKTLHFVEVQIFMNAALLALADFLRFIPSSCNQSILLRFTGLSLYVYTVSMPRFLGIMSTKHCNFRLEFSVLVSPASFLPVNSTDFHHHKLYVMQILYTIYFTQIVGNCHISCSLQSFLSNSTPW